MKHISEIINKILIEWSYMLPDGIPNMKNSYHMVKLKEALKKVNFSDDLINELMSNLHEKKPFVPYKNADLDNKKKDEEPPKPSKIKNVFGVKRGNDEPVDPDSPESGDPGGADVAKELQKKEMEKEEEVDENVNLTELDFKNTDSFKKYQAKHKMRSSTKVNIGGKDTTVGDVEGEKDTTSDDSISPEEQKQKETEKNEFLLDMASGLLEISTEDSGVGRFNMSKEDLDKYKSYLKGDKPKIPNHDISDDEVGEMVGILKSTLGGNFQSFVQRVRKKGDPPKEYASGEAGKERFYSCMKHYMQTGGRSTITGEFVPFSESQLDHVTSLDNGGVDGPENWEWMESRFNQFKGALTDKDVMSKIKSNLDKSPDEDKLKTLNQSFRKYSKEAFINHYGNKFKDGGNAGLTEESINKMNGNDVNAMIKGWNKNHPDGSEFFIPRYGAKKDASGKEIDRKSGRASGGRIASKPELIKRFLEKSKASGTSIPSKAETDAIDKDFQSIISELDKKKGEISKLKQKIKQQKVEK
jgi:hypothetical protein